MKKDCLYCGSSFEKDYRTSVSEWLGSPRRPNGVRFCSRACSDSYRRGRMNPNLSHPHTAEAKAEMSRTRKGRKATLETRRKISEAGKRRVAEGKHNNYRGGITSENQLIKGSHEYKQWRLAVFRRDGYRCVWCGSNRNIQADHIKPFAYFPELRLSIANGRTLCIQCHKKTDTYGPRCNKLYKHISMGEREELPPVTEEAVPAPAEVPAEAAEAVEAPAEEAAA